MSQPNKRQKTLNWIKPSFGDFGFTSSQPSLPVNDDNDNSDLRRKIRKKSLSNPTVCSKRIERASFAVKYRPANKKDLAVHRKKIEELECWLADRINSHSPQTRPLGPPLPLGCLLILTGPTGSCKTATLLCVAEQLGFDVVEWVNPTSESSFDKRNDDLAGLRKDSTSCLDYASTSKQWGFERSQTDTFKDFLLRSDHYASLSDQSPENLVKPRLLFVEDLPNAFYRDPMRLQIILEHYVGRMSITKRCPLVLIVSDSPSSSLHNLRHLLPADFQKRLGMIKIEKVYVSELLCFNCNKINTVGRWCL